ncbi:hypothetical protein JCM10908_002293 [Rhodotorula pacifica]|uniref:uncharacterized protein n=1 Tax=Rhodotorula pacifica TaxID=1495444 RepID=UPI00316C304A
MAGQDPLGGSGSGTNTSPAPPPTAPSSSFLLSRPADNQVDTEQCLTPPSVRRREARLARCQVQYDCARAAAAAAAARAQQEQQEEGGTPAVQPRRGYGEEEVAARRQVAQRQDAAQDHQANVLHPPRHGESLVRTDGTVNWDALPSDGVVVNHPGLGAGALNFLRTTPALGSRLTPSRRAFLDSLEAPPLRPPPASPHVLLGGTGGSDSVSGTTLSLLLAAVLVVLHLVRSRRSANATNSHADTLERKVAFHRHGQS